MIEINKRQAIMVMEENLRRIKKSANTDTFLLLSYDLENSMSLGRIRMNFKSGKKLVGSSKTFVLNNDSDKDSVSTLSIYTDAQNDIFNIIPVGKKHDMIIMPHFK